jgi:hypothetical protein
MEVIANHDAARRWMLAGGALLLAMVGCMMGQTTQVRWDLRHSHTKKDVQWTDSVSATEVSSADLTILLPGDHTFVGKNVKARMMAEGDQVQILSIFYAPETLDDGYKRARQLAQDWGLGISPLDSWYQEVQAARKQGKRDRDAPLPIAVGGKPLSPDGPTPYARILYSFDQQKPALVNFELQWVPGA